MLAEVVLFGLLPRVVEIGALLSRVQLLGHLLEFAFEGSH
jgi:hypothetical protein